jgi:hypothetical protein
MARSCGVFSRRMPPPIPAAGFPSNFGRARPSTSTCSPGRSNNHSRMFLPWVVSQFEILFIRMVLFRGCKPLIPRSFLRSGVSNDGRANKRYQRLWKILQDCFNPKMVMGRSSMFLTQIPITSQVLTSAGLYSNFLERLNALPNEYGVWLELTLTSVIFKRCTAYGNLWAVHNPYSGFN